MHAQKLHFLLSSIVWFYVFWNCLLEKMQSHTDCNCLIFLYCVCFLNCIFSNESSNRLFGKMHSHNGYIAFLHCCAFKWALISRIWEDASPTGCIHWICLHSLHCHTGCFCLTFSYCVFTNDSSNHLFGKMYSHTGCTFLLFLFSVVSSLCLFEKMHGHNNCSCKIVMLTAFVGHLFPFCVYKWVLKSPA